DSFRNPCALIFPVFILGLFGCGVYAFYRQDRRKALLYLLPIFLTLLAAMLGKYPFRGRVILFLIPSYYVFIALGFEKVVGLLKGFQKWGALCLALLLLAAPLKDAFAHFTQSRDWVQNREALEFLRDHYEAGDFLVMNTSAMPPFWYYAGSLGFGRMFKQDTLAIKDGQLVKGVKVAQFARYLGEGAGGRFLALRYEYHVYDDKGFFREVLGLKDPPQMLKEGQAFSSPPLGRTWVFLSKAPEDDDRIMNNIIRDSFDKRAKRLLASEQKNAAVYLYDLK
ncbi:MAG: hypothetical protein HQL16_07185, partial [Candidatus Omnitrophica bacterium]|nr:hypothetical protein [Candidatus Omnitrophota bacterium]